MHYVGVETVVRSDLGEEWMQILSGLEKTILFQRIQGYSGTFEVDFER